MAEHEGLSKAISDRWTEEDEMVIGWVVAAEVIAEDGTRKLRWDWSDGLKTYQLKGYCHEVLDSQVAGEVADLLVQED